jgi:hypothetical protein
MCKLEDNSSPLYELLWPHKFRKCSSVFFHGLWKDFIVDKLSIAARFDEPGVRQGLKMMRHGGGRNPLQGHDFAAVHVFPGSDSLKNRQAGLIA